MSSSPSGSQPSSRSVPRRRRPQTTRGRTRECGDRLGAISESGQPILRLAACASQEFLTAMREATNLNIQLPHTRPHQVEQQQQLQLPPLQQEQQQEQPQKQQQEQEQEQQLQQERQQQPPHQEQQRQLRGQRSIVFTKTGTVTDSPRGRS